MKTIMIAIVGLSLFLQASGQNDSVKRSLHKQDSFKLKSWDHQQRLNILYQNRKDALPKDWHFKLPDSEKSLKQYSYMGPQHYRSNMPIDSLIFPRGSFNMPILVPDSTVKFHMKIIGVPTNPWVGKENRIR